MRPELNEGATPGGAAIRTRTDEQKATQRGGTRAFRAVLVGTLIALVAGMAGIPPTSAFGAVLEVDDPTADDGSTTTTSTTSTTFSGIGDTDTPLDPALNDAKGTVDDLLDTADEDGDLPRLSEEEEEPDETEEPEEEPKDEPDESESEEPEADDSEGTEDAEEEDEEEPEVPQRTENMLTTLRAFDISNAAPIVNVEPGAVWNYPSIDFVDVPLGPRSTKEIVELLESEGLATPTNVAAVLAPFPVAGEARYSNDWGAPRHIPSYHPHEGTDLFASRGTPVISSFDGVVTNIGDNTAIGGNSVRVTGADGTYAYYAHLEDFAPGLSTGDRVSVGDVLGTVGTSGNARGGVPHLHYEIHPGGGEPQPPLPYLDRWLADARERAEALVNGRGGSGPAVAAALPPRVDPPSLNAFENAANRSDSPAATVALVAILGGAFLAYRQRRRFGDLLAVVSHGVSPVAERLGFDAFRKFSQTDRDSEEPDRHEVRDVLAPFLQSDDGPESQGSSEE